MEKNAAVSLSEVEDIGAIEERMQGFIGQREAVMQQIRELRASECRDAGKHCAHEIFMLQQEKLRLDTEIDICEKKIRRIKYFADM